MKALKINREKVVKLYDIIISAAVKTSFISVKAFSNERAGIFLQRIGDKDMAYTYLNRAKSCYKKWEASAKLVQMIKNEWTSRATSPKSRLNICV